MEFFGKVRTSGTGNIVHSSIIDIYAPKSPLELVESYCACSRPSVWTRYIKEEKNSKHDQEDSKYPCSLLQNACQQVQRQMHIYIKPSLLVISRDGLAYSSTC